MTRKHLQLVGKPQHNRMRMCSLRQATKGSLQLELNQGHCHIGCGRHLMDVATTGGSFCRRSGLARTASQAVMRALQLKTGIVSNGLLHDGYI